MGVYIDKIDLMRLSKIRVAPARSVLDVLQGFNLTEIDLVRCGECKWSYTDERDGLMWCKVHMSHYRVNADHFCSYGEPRESEYVAKD